MSRTSMLPLFSIIKTHRGLGEYHMTLLEFLVDMLFARCDSFGRWTQNHRRGCTVLMKNGEPGSLSSVSLIARACRWGYGFDPLVSFLPVKGVECPICEMRRRT